MSACSGGHVEVVKYLIENQSLSFRDLKATNKVKQIKTNQNKTIKQ